jgi:hypothetical protein
MGLLDTLSNLNPEQTQGLLAAAAQMLQQSGPSRTPVGFGQVVGGGLQAYQGSMIDAKRRKQEEEHAAQLARMREMQMQGMQGDLAEQQRARDEQQAIMGAAKGAYRTPGQQAAALPGGPTIENAARIPDMAGGLDEDAFINSVSAINPLKALELRKQFAKQGIEYSTDVKVANGPDGKPVLYVMGKNGQPKLLDGMTPREKADLVAAGGKHIATNLYDVKPGTEFKHTQTPDSLASIGMQRERLNFEKGQAGRPQFNADLGGFITPPNAQNPGGSLTPLAGAPARATKMTEDQGKATGWLVQAENAFGNMKKAITKDPSAAKPGFNDALEAIPSFGMSGALANTMRSPERQQFMQGASSLSEALLRAATGAGVNRDEALQKVRELTPVFGEDETTTQQKMDAIPLYIESLKVRAGPGAPLAAGVLGNRSAAGTDGWSIKKVD